MTVLRTAMELCARISPLGFIGLAASALGAEPLQSTNCVSDWVMTGTGSYGFFSSESTQPPRIFALAVYDDGSGAKLYAAGDFDVAGGAFAANLAVWDGSDWSALPCTGLEGTNDPEVLALQVYDDGEGSALYVGGRFFSAGGVAARGIAKWDGDNWSSAGFQIPSEVYSLSVFDRGAGPELVVGGFFTKADLDAPLPGSGTEYLANNIVSWNGSRLQRFGGGLNQRVSALEVSGDGSTLYAGGMFSIAGVTPVQNLARWDSQGWSDPGGGVNGSVFSLESFDDGTGSQLYVGGGFTEAGGQTAFRTARFDGSTWSSFAGLPSAPLDLLAFDDGSGRALFAAGGFGQGDFLRRWSGGVWEPIGAGLAARVFALAAYDDGDGPDLYLGGAETVVNQWDGTSITAVVGPGLDANVTALAVHNDGGGTRAYLSGNFSASSAVGSDNLATWDGTNFAPVGGGIDGPAHAMAEFADSSSGASPVLYVGGDFTTAGGQPASRIARWDGANWSALGLGVNGRVTEMRVWDDGQGGGPALYVLGEFTMAGGLSAGGIARYDGTQWMQVGTGVGFQSTGAISPNALEVFDDGTGPALYVGGLFQAVDGVQSLNAARWDGLSWSSIGAWSGPPGRIEDLAVYDSGSGPELFAGVFQVNPVVQTFGVVTWDGSQWNDVVLTAANTGANPPIRTAGGSLTVLEEAEGTFLYAAGSEVSPNSRGQVSRFDGTTWSALPGIFDGKFDDSVAWDRGDGPALLVGGRLFASPAGETHLALWQTCALLEGVCFGDGGTAGCTPCPCGNDASPGTRGGCLNSNAMSARLVGSGSTDVAVGSLRFEVNSAVPNSVAMLISAGAALPAMGPCPAGSGVISPVFDGIRCVGLGIQRVGLRGTDAQGDLGVTNAGFGPPDSPAAGIAAVFGYTAGQTRFFQVIYRDDPTMPCGTGLNTTNAVRVLFR